MQNTPALISIIPSVIGGHDTQTVNARDLWEFLNSKQDFSTWIKSRIEQFDFMYGVDYIAPQKNGAQESKTCGQERIAYFLSLDMAKEIAMVERTLKGKEARRYFIECERKAKSNNIVLPSYSEALRHLADTLDKNQELIALNEAQKPAVEFVEKYVEAENLLGFRQVAKLLKIKEPNFRDFLNNNKIMYKLGGEWVSYAHHLDAGRFQASTGVADNEHAYTSHKFTTKGVQWIAGLIATKKVSAVIV